MSTAAVRATFRRREPRPSGADLEAAQGQGTGDIGGVQPAVCRVSRASSQENSHLPEIVSSNAPL